MGRMCARTPFVCEILYLFLSRFCQTFCVYFTPSLCTSQASVCVLYLTPDWTCSHSLVQTTFETTLHSTAACLSLVLSLPRSFFLSLSDDPFLCLPFTIFLCYSLCCFVSLFVPLPPSVINAAVNMSDRIHSMCI